MSNQFRSLSALFFLFIALTFPARSHAFTFVWKVTNAENQFVYLGGSSHALRTSDYPLPAAFEQTLDKCSVLALEVDPKEMAAAEKGFMKAATYPKGDSLKNHVDPRTYDYISRLFGLLGVPREKVVRYRPWFIALALQTAGAHGLSPSLGVERFLVRRAQATSKRVIGLESAREHADVMANMSDREGEALLLLTFIPADPGTPNYSRIIKAWRNGETDLPWQFAHDGFRDFPSLGDRMLTVRNRSWVPKIEAYMRSGKTHFVVAGAAHFGGPSGLIALLRTRGYKIEQL